MTLSGPSRQMVGGSPAKVFGDRDRRAQRIEWTWRNLRYAAFSIAHRPESDQQVGERGVPRTEAEAVRRYMVPRRRFGDTVGGVQAPSPSLAETRKL